MGEAGHLVASGRDGDIYEYAPGLVLRRARGGRVIEHEARIMDYAAEHGYPVPRVEEVRAGGTEIIMERLDGPMMMDAMTKRPHTLLRNSRLLADLHDRLHEIPAPDWLRRVEATGDRLLHLDLHPMNVMLTSRGPVVIDWTNAAAGQPLTDVAVSYVILKCARNPAPPVIRQVTNLFRNRLVSAFVDRYPAAELRAAISYAAQLKLLDPNLHPDEKRHCESLVPRWPSG